jgi:hypothetical protein
MTTLTSIRPYAPDDLAALVLRDDQTALRALAANVDQAKLLDIEGLAHTAVVDGRTVACFGMVPQWAGRSTCWVILGDVPDVARPGIIDAAREKLDAAQRLCRRLDMTVADDDGEGHALAAELGFTVEGILLAYAPGGGDRFSYSRIAAA